MAPDSSPRPDERLQSERPAPPQPPNEQTPGLAADYALRRAPWTTYAVGLAVLALMLALNLWTRDLDSVDWGSGFPLAYRRTPMMVRLGDFAPVIRATIAGQPPADPELLDARERARQRIPWSYDCSAMVLNTGTALILALAAMLIWTVVVYRPTSAKLLPEPDDAGGAS